MIILEIVVQHLQECTHSNAGCESVFSFVAEKHSKSRSSMPLPVDNIESTTSHASEGEEGFKMEFDKTLLRKCKSTLYQSNQ